MKHVLIFTLIKYDDMLYILYILQYSSPLSGLLVHQNDSIRVFQIMIFEPYILNPIPFAPQYQ